MTHRQAALLELLLASLIWGFGFIATIWVLPGIGPIWVTSIRFILAIAMLDFIYRSRGLGFAPTLRPLRYSWVGLKSCFWPGVFLFALLTFQTWGLKYTSATKSGFITVLYVLFVPFLEKAFLKRKIEFLVWAWIALGLIGTLLICGAWTATDGFAADFLGSFNVGDGLTFLCALAAAGHLIVVNYHLSDSSTTNSFTDSPVTFHIYQSAWVALFAAIFGYLIEGFSWPTLLLSGAWDWKVWAGLFHLAFLSSGVAFLIQVRAQRFVSPTTVGLMVLLESPWAMLGSVTLLGEILTGWQGLGAGFILLAAVGECIRPTRRG